jgi:hypothetical protein
MTDVDILNLVCAEGLRSVKLNDVLRVRLLNPALDSELHRALEIIAGGRDHQKKSVSLAFKGDGKRAVKVGYVVESPMWKTTYRLVLGQDAKATLQGWALVENTTDDDWNNVKMALVSGRPISFQMDLYQPLYVPRPTVEPERFASLRPPSYSGPITNTQLGFTGALGALGAIGPQGVGGGGAIGSIAGGGAGGGSFQGALGFAGGNNQTNLGFGGGVLGNRYQPGSRFGSFNNTQVTMDDDNARPRLTYEQLKQREKELREARGQAKRVGAEVAGLDPTEGVESVASTEAIGDVCRYAIDERVTLPRQKSAMLPIVQRPIVAAKVSIYNEAVHNKFPLLGLRFRNADQPMTQGPVTVYDGSSYAGDSRIQDLQPGEERLLSYAVDTGTEVKVESPEYKSQFVALKTVQGVLHATQRMRKPHVYLIKNRSSQDRTLVIEQPYNPDWTLVEPKAPAEKTRDLYRFNVPVKAGEAVRFEVVEECRRIEKVRLDRASDATIELYVSDGVMAPKLKEAIEKMKSLNAQLLEASHELGKVEARLKEITDDQSRLRANFEKVPPTSAAYKRYLEKFDKQETEIEKLQADIKARAAEEATRRKDLEDYVAGLTIDG